MTIKEQVENSELKEMEKYSSYHIQTDGFQQVLIGIRHMVQTVLLDRKCRIIIDYDPALPKVNIETFIDKSDEEQVQEKLPQLVLGDSMQ